MQTQWGKIGLILGLFVVSCLYATEQLPVSIKGDALVYTDNLIVASGNAELVYGGYAMSADSLQINTQTNQITGLGHTRVAREDGETLNGERFEYAINAEQLTMYVINTRLQPAMAKEEVLVRLAIVQNMRVSNNVRDVLSGSGCRLTTCDLEDPHYWVKAKEFLYYPDNKIVAYHMTAHFWLSPLPLFYTPYYVFYTGKRKVVFTFPKIGSNTVEGNFVKTETKYFVDDVTEGSIFVDAMSIKGNGKGWQHKYNFGYPGSFSIYQVREEDTYPKRTSSVVNWHQEYGFLGTDTLTLDHKYRKIYLLPSGYDDKIEERLQYKFAQDKDNVNLDYSTRQDYIALAENQKLSSSWAYDTQSETVFWQKDYRQADRYRSEGLNLQHQINISEEWRYRINPVYSRISRYSQTFDERLDLGMDLDLTPQEKKYYQSMNMHYNVFVDPDGDRVTADNLSNEFVERLPEVTVRGVRANIGSPTENLAYFSIDSTYAVGEIREAKYFPAYSKRRVFATERFSADYSFFKIYDIGLASITLMRNYKQTGYQTQDAHYLLSDRPKLTADWFGFIRNEVIYEDTRGEGNSPFFFDDPRIATIKRGNHLLTFYQRRQWSASISQSKDYINTLFDDYLYTANLDPLENGLLTFRATSGKNHYTNIYRDLVAGLTLHPVEKQYYRLNYTKDINNNFDDNPYAGKLKSASSEADLLLGKPYKELGYWSFWESEWHMIVKNNYDFATEYLNLVSFAVGKDLHCWYMRYNFTPLRKEWYVVFTLKAFPEEPFTVKGNEAEDFSFQAFSEELNAGEIRRYE